MRRLRLKVCGMKNAQNIAAIGALSPDFMGFIFVPESPRYVGESLTRDALSLPSSVRKIGVFSDASIEDILERCAALGLDGAQLHGDEDASYLLALRRALPTITIIKAIKVREADDLAALSGADTCADMYLFDSGHGGSGRAFNWGLIPSYSGEVPFMLAGGIGLKNLEEVAKLARQYPLLAGIDVNTQVEIVPGLKDAQQIRALVERLEV